MSKSKKSDIGFKIFYKIIATALTLATFPIAYLISLFHLNYTAAIFGLLSGDSTDTGASYFEMSLYRLIPLIDFGGSSSGFPRALTSIKTPLIITICLFIALAVLAIVIIGFVIFSNMKKVITCLSGGALAILVGIYFCFNNIETHILNGELSLASLTTEWWGALLQYAATLESFSVGPAYAYICLLFVGLFLWTISFVIVDLDEEKSKKIKKPKKVKAKN